MLTPTSASKIQKINVSSQTVYNLLSGDNSRFDGNAIPRAVQAPQVRSANPVGRFQLHQNRGFQVLQARAAASRNR